MSGTVRVRYRLWVRHHGEVMRMADVCDVKADSVEDAKKAALVVAAGKYELIDEPAEKDKRPQDQGKKNEVTVEPAGRFE